MRPVNIYALTRVLDDTDRISRMERQMSGRERAIKIKEWEMQSLRAFCDNLCQNDPGAYDIRFFFSFTLPKLGKEFDLLRIDRDSVINVELKSRSVSDEAIRKQLLQNRYYLAMLGRNMQFFSFTGSTGRLVRLSNSGRLVEASWEKLSEALNRQKRCFEGNIEELYKESRYLISPLTDPGRFLRRDYFLTSQQRDIKSKILRNVKKERRDTFIIQGFTGLPGTGKTILLYDLAVELSVDKPVCLLHFGIYPAEITELNRRLKRVDFYDCGVGDTQFAEKNYNAIFVDEGHRIDPVTLAAVCEYAKSRHIPVIVSYDSEAPIALPERKQFSTDSLEALPGFIRFKLTNRIRLNNETSSFIQCVMRVKGRMYRRDYPNITLVYANDMDEARVLLHGFHSEGYVYIHDGLVENSLCGTGHNTVEIGEATSLEFDRVVMLIDSSFVYDKECYLRSGVSTGDGRVRHLYHGMNRARRKVALIVCDNLAVFDRLLGIIQR